MKLLDDFTQKHTDAKSRIGAWKAEIEEAKWNTPHDLKSRYPKASLIRDQLVVFNICGNRYRLLTQINYKNRIVLVKKVGTHKEYDNWNIG